MDQIPVLEPHPQLYFSDSDIVLAAEVSSKPTSTASSHSKYQLYCVNMDNIRRWDPNTPIAITPTLRIADKYLVSALHKYLAQKVVYDWPLTLEEWDRREAEIEVIRYTKSTPGALSPPHKSLAQSVPGPASAIRFAFEFGCPEILPAAFCQLARTDVSSDWDVPRSYAARADLPARWTLLEGQELLRYLRGGKKLSQHAASVPSDETFTAILCRSCLPWWEDAGIPDDVRWEVEDERNVDGYPCYSLLQRIFRTVLREASPGIRDPLKSLKDCVTYEGIPEVSVLPAKSLCTGCKWGLGNGCLRRDRSCG